MIDKRGGSKSSAHADPVLVRRRAGDFSFSYVQIDLTANAAEQTCCLHYFLGWLVVTAEPVAQCAGRAEVNTGTAELAARFQMGEIECRAHHGIWTAVMEFEGVCLPDFLTDPYTPAAQNAQVVITVKERIITLDIEISVPEIERYVLYPEFSNQILKLAVVILRT